jgi:dienelactone hydrolase
MGRYRIGERRLTLAGRRSAGRETVVLPVVVRYPVIAGISSPSPGHGLFPVVVFAPGYRQCIGSYRILLREWASAGYVVAAVAFPRTNCHVLDPDENDLVNQPREMIAVIRRLLAISRQRHGLLAGLIDPAKVAIAGHSDGGDTVAAIAANTCCRYHRIAAAIVLSGAEWPPMQGRYFAGPSPPMLFAQGTADTWNQPTACMQLYRADTTGPRFYLDLFGANHFSPYEGGGPPEPVVARVTIDFLDRYLAGERGAARAMRRAARIRGVAALVAGGRPPP